MVPRDLEAVIKSAASAASLGFAGERTAPHRPSAEPSSQRCPANPREAALGADWITLEDKSECQKSVKKVSKN